MAKIKDELERRKEEAQKEKYKAGNVNESDLKKLEKAIKKAKAEYDDQNVELLSLMRNNVVRGGLKLSIGDIEYIHFYLNN